MRYQTRVVPYQRCLFQIGWPGGFGGSPWQWLLTGPATWELMTLHPFSLTAVFLSLTAVQFQWNDRSGNQTDLDQLDYFKRGRQRFGWKLHSLGPWTGRVIARSACTFQLEMDLGCFNNGILWACLNIVENLLKAREAFIVYMVTGMIVGEMA